jgi:hypothetical protein
MKIRGIVAFALAATLAPNAAFAKTEDVAIASAILDPQFRVPSPSELAPYDAAGTSRVNGRFNLPLSGTKARLEYGGRTVYLLPAVAWSYVWAFTLARAVSQDGMRTLPFAPWTRRYLRKTVTDAHGNFAFENVPPGKYVLGSYVSSRVGTAHAYVTDDPELSTDSSYEYDENTGQYQSVSTVVTEHHYTQHVSTTTCDVYAALEAVVTVKGTEPATNVPVQIAGSYYDGECSK